MTPSVNPALADARYAARALAQPSATDEALEVRAFAPMEIPWQERAFWSDERALRDHPSRRAAPAPPAPR